MATNAELKARVAQLEGQLSAKQGYTIELRVNEGDDLQYGAISIGKRFAPSKKFPEGFFRPGLGIDTVPEMEDLHTQLGAYIKANK